MIDWNVTLIFMTFSSTLYFSIAGFNSAAIFEELDDDDIKYVEEFARKNIRELITLNQDENVPFTMKHQKIFFGLNTLNPDTFEFTRGNKKLVNKIVRCVKETITGAASEQAGFALFHKPIKVQWWKNLYRTPLGLFYADHDFAIADSIQSVQNIHKVQSALSKDNLEKSLYKKAKMKTDSYKSNTFAPKRELSMDHVLVDVSDGASVDGSVDCNFCDENALEGRVKVFFQRTKSSGYWIMSNLDKHFPRYHGPNCVSKLPAKRKRKPCSTSDKDNGIGPSGMSFGDTSTLLALKIEPAAKVIKMKNELGTDLEDLLFTQMSRQNIQMINGTLNHDEDIVFFYKDTDQETLKKLYIKICNINGNGSCLFGALSHQIYRSKINSSEHQSQTHNLRRECVEYIQNNFERFLPYLKGRITEDCDRNNINTKTVDLRQECLKFLQNILPLPTTFAGMEAIKAASEIHKINIVTILVNDEVQMRPRLNTSFERTLFITYKNNNHYDSVAEIDTETISRYANKLAADEIELLTKENVSVDLTKEE